MVTGIVQEYTIKGPVQEYRFNTMVQEKYSVTGEV
jgi:hypothetical protein